MTEYLGIIAFMVCIVHFIYQAIILPSSRQSARDELFKLRDELRNTLIEVQDESDKRTLRAYKEVDDGISRAIGRLHLLTFSNFLKVSRNSDKQLNENFKKFHLLLKSIDDTTPIDIYCKVNKTLEKVLVLNSFMLVLYFLPLVAIISLIGAVVRRCKASADYLVETCIVKRNIQSGSLTA